MYIDMTRYDDEPRFNAEYNEWCDLCEVAEQLEDELNRMASLIEDCEAVTDDQWQDADRIYCKVLVLLDRDYLNEWRIEYAKEIIEDLCESFSWIA